MTANLNSILSLFQSQQSTSTSGIDPRTRDINLLKNAGATDEQIATVTDRASAETLAAELGITLPALPDPPQGQSPQGSIFDGQFGQTGEMDGLRPSGPPPEITSALKAAGATDEEISSITGPDVAKSLADKYGIELPKPPAPPAENGENASISSITSILQQLIGINSNS